MNDTAEVLEAPASADVRADALKAIEQGGSPTLALIWDRVQRRHSTDALRDAVEELLNSGAITSRRDERFVTHYAMRDAAQASAPDPEPAATVRDDVSTVAKRLEDKAARKQQSAPAPESPEPDPAPSAATAPETSQPKATATKHGETREKVFQAIAEAASGITLTQLAELLGMTTSGVAYNVRALAEAKRIRSKKVGQAMTWSATGSGGGSPVADFVAKKRTEKKVKAGRGKRSVSHNCMPAEALAHLEARLKRAPIVNLERKVAVLQRLEQLLDPTIGAILAEIRGDLQAT